MEFPKKYKFRETEQKWRDFWEDEHIYRFAPDSDKPIFSVDTPPPYVSSAHLHVGHAMSYTQVEFIVRYKRMKGFNIFYPMGFDDNGLPTERYVEKKYKINKSKIQRDEFIKLCLKETREGAKTYEKLWRLLGLSIDWSYTYSTIDERSRRTSQRSFLELYEKGLIERRNDPVQWCIQDQTALAQADISIEERDSHLHDIEFNSDTGQALIISTTRPELIPACVALYAHPEDPRYKSLAGHQAKIPLFNYTVPIKFDDTVDPEFGTGLMMVCTFGDIEDVIKWRKDNLDTRLVINDNGILNELAGDYAGMKMKAARAQIVADLNEKGLLHKSVALKHNVGIHERCGTAVEFVMRPQWFINILNRKDQFLKRAEELKWFPDFMKVRYHDWVKNLKWDWNISRQRYYGVPFPVWYCGDCQQVMTPPLERLPVDPCVDPSPLTNCPACQSKSIIPENDVMDTWMTSSLTPLINSRWADDDPLHQKIYPMSIRPQAFEIIRTWLFYTIVKSDFHTDSLPWETAMISGWGLDKDGKKMSKRHGNFVDPQTIIEQSSADSLRYWAAKATLGNDLRYNEEDIKNGKRLQTKLWNAARFLHQNISEFIPGEQEYERLTIDKWVLSQLQKTISQASGFLEVYEYSQALRVTERFFWEVYCDNYLEIVKDRLWNPEEYSEKVVIGAKETLYNVFLNLIKLFAPFLPYISEELYELIYKKFEGRKSIHAAAWPEAASNRIDEDAESKAALLISILKGVRKRKTALQIHQNSWISELSITGPDKMQEQISEIASDLKAAIRTRSISFDKPAAFPTEHPEIQIDVLV